MACISIYASFQPDANIFQGRLIAFGVSFILLSIGTNILATLSIVIRVLILKKYVGEFMSPDSARLCSYAMKIVLQSEAIFIVFGIANLVPYAMKSQTTLAFLQIWGDFCVSECVHLCSVCSAAVLSLGSIRTASYVAHCATTRRHRRWRLSIH
jgi:hypothetical protein